MRYIQAFIVLLLVVFVLIPLYLVAGVIAWCFGKKRNYRSRHASSAV